MKTIKDLLVQVTYTVNLKDAEVSDDVYTGLYMILASELSTEKRDSYYVREALRWLATYVKEECAMDRGYKIISLVS